MKKVLVVGSINMDYTVYVDCFPKNGETIFGEARHIQPGGKGANQAVALAKSSKVECTFIGAIGSDSDGKSILSALQTYRVKTNIKTSKIETGNATIVVDGSSENKIIIIGGANKDVLPEDISENMIRKADYIVLQNEIPAETNEYVMRKAHEFNKTIIYNPAPYRELKPELFCMIDYFIPNETELMQFTGTNDIDEGAKKILSLGCKNVIVTLGSKGCVLFKKDKKIFVDAYETEAIDTVAAGDTFVGYFVSGIATEMSETKALKYASKASSITVSRRGSLISIPYGKEVNI